MGKPVKIAILTDASDSVRGFDKAGDAAQHASSRFDSVADSSDNVASKGAQAAGALSGLGDLIGGPFGNSMMVAGIGMQAAADAGDLLNVVTESAIVRKIKDTAVTVAQTAKQAAMTAATKAATAAQWAMNAAMSANPLGLVILAIVALVAALVVAYKKSETFRRIVDGAFKAVWGAAQTAFGWIKKNWPLLLAIITGPIGLAVLAVVKNWDKITAGASRMRDGVVNRFKAVVNWVKELPGRVSRAAGNLNRTLYNKGVDLITGFLNGIKDKAADIAGWIENNVLDKIPGPLRGAIGLSGGKAVGGGLRRSSVDDYADTLTRARSGPSVPTSGTTVVQVAVQVDPLAAPVDTGRAVMKVLKAYANSQGGRLVVTGGTLR